MERVWVVTYTSMMLPADDEDDAIARAMESSGGEWEAKEMAWDEATHTFKEVT